MIYGKRPKKEVRTPTTGSVVSRTERPETSRRGRGARVGNSRGAVSDTRTPSCFGRRVVRE